jgi:hypothetical protein
MATDFSVSDAPCAVRPYSRGIPREGRVTRPPSFCYAIAESGGGAELDAVCSGAFEQATT